MDPIPQTGRVTPTGNSNGIYSGWVTCCRSNNIPWFPKFQSCDVVSIIHYVSRLAKNVLQRVDLVLGTRIKDQAIWRQKTVEWNRTSLNNFISVIIASRPLYNKSNNSLSRMVSNNFQTINRATYDRVLEMTTDRRWSAVAMQHWHGGTQNELMTAQEHI